MPFHKHIGFLLLSTSFVVGAAEVPLTLADLLGTWQIEKESVNADGSGGRSMNTTWNFKNDGTMEGISQENDAHARVDQLKAVLNYSVEDGRLKKQAAPGRSKTETCVATAKDGNKLVLKCSSIYFFMTKK